MRGLVIFVTMLIMLTSSCQSVPQPVEEYTLARAAIEAARAVQAPRHSPGYWHQADEAYRQGRLLYKDRDYTKAREAFIKARIAAEKAENSARLIRQKTGDVL
ncbi:MAG TPA: DUF4398 domain-containing protein [Pseudobdellovibrionaceae bacterium]